MRFQLLSFTVAFLASLLTGFAHAQGTRSIALVIDASGSMNARLPDGVSRLQAAKSAAAQLVATLPGETRLALRVYGHQSPTKQKDCKDTALVVPFDAVASNKPAIIDKTGRLEALGYTPITYVLQLAAEEVGKEAADSRVVVLVSDGKETCQGDPCLTAKALAAADARLVVHTVGIGVDAATKHQLMCIASMARGSYFDANNAAELASVLGRAAAAPPVQKAIQIVVGGPAVGKLQVKGAAADFLDIIDAASGKKIADVSVGRDTQTLPAGLYRVVFPNGIWQGIEVRPGETTVIEPGVLEIKTRDLRGHKLIEPETGETLMTFSVAYQRKALLPSRMSVSFGAAIWPDVEIKAGQTTVLNPGVIKIKAPGQFKYMVKGADGSDVGEMSNIFHTMPLPPGKYSLVVKDRTVPIDLNEGQAVEIKIE